MSKFRTYIDEVTDELQNKVSWPTWAELQSSAVVVLVSVIIISIVIFAMDFGSSKIMEFYYGLFHK